MGSVQDEGTTVWIRVWDGTEMEYDTFDREELKTHASQLSNPEVASRIGAVHDNKLERLLNKIRKEE